jgi:tetratricopeptide (TPR) repeat protein
VAVAVLAVVLAVPWAAAAAAVAPGVTPDGAAPAVSDSRRQAEAAFQQRDYDRARAGFLALVASAPNDPELHLRLGWIALETGRSEEATARFEQAARLAPTNGLYTLWLARSFGVRARTEGFPNGIPLVRHFKAALLQAVAIDPGCAEARLDLVQFYLDAPGIVGGSVRKAAAAAEELARTDTYLGAVAKGKVLESEKKWDEAERTYQGAVIASPSRPEARLALGGFYQQRRRFADALGAFDALVQLNLPDRGPYRSGSVEARFHYGETAVLAGGPWERAERELEAYLRSVPDVFMPTLASAHFRLGNVLEHQGAMERARAEYAAALRLEPGHKDARKAIKRLG